MIKIIKDFRDYQTELSIDNKDDFIHVINEKVKMRIFT